MTQYVTTVSEKVRVTSKPCWLALAWLGFYSARLYDFLVRDGLFPLIGLWA